MANPPALPALTVRVIRATAVELPSNFILGHPQLASDTKKK